MVQWFRLWPFTAMHLGSNPSQGTTSVEPLWQVRVTWPWALSQHAHLPYPSMPSDPLPACSPAFSQHAPWPSPSMLPAFLPSCSPAFYHHAPWPSPSMLPSPFPVCSPVLSQHAPWPSPIMLPGPLPTAPSHGPVSCQSCSKEAPSPRGSLPATEALVGIFCAF